MLLPWGRARWRRAFIDQQADRHHLNAVIDWRIDGFAVRALGFAAQAQHQGLAGAVDVGVEQADTLAPSAARAKARLTAVVLLPTPPLPDAMAITLRTPGSGGLSPRGCVRLNFGCPGDFYGSHAGHRFQGLLDQRGVFGPTRTRG